VGLRPLSIADEDGLRGRDTIRTTWARGEVFASSPAIRACVSQGATVGSRAVRVTATSRKFLVRFRLMDTPCFGNGINLFLRGFGVIRGIISGCWGGARNIRGVRRVIIKSGSSRSHALLLVSVAGSDRFIFSIDGGPCIHGGLGAMSVARWSTSIERPIVVEHYLNSRVRRVKMIKPEKDVLGPTPVKSRRSMISACMEPFLPFERCVFVLSDGVESEEWERLAGIG